MRKQYHFWPADTGFDAWDVDRLIELSRDLPVHPVAVESISEVDTAYWFEGSAVAPTVRNVVEHARLMLTADLSYPVILGHDGRVMDGMHRIARALLDGVAEVNAVRFPYPPEPDYRNIQPDQLPGLLAPAESDPGAARSLHAGTDGWSPAGSQLYALELAGQVRDGLLVGITLMATSLGILVPILKDARQTETLFGHLTMAAGSLAELCPLVLLSVFFSASSENPSVELGLLAAFVGLTVFVAVAAERVRGWGPLREVVHRLEDTSSQLRVRLAITFALAFAVVAEHFGLATILGAFLAGVIVRRTGESPTSHEVLKGKLEAIGFGFLIPVFFVSTGAGLDIDALFRSSRAMLLVPVFLVTLLAARGLPALLYIRTVGRTHALAAGFMQATSLTFIVVATIIGVGTHHQRSSTATALVVAGLLSVIIYPPIALQLLKSSADNQASRPSGPAPAAAKLARPEEPP